MLQYDEEIGRLYSCCDDKKVISWDVQQLRQIKAFDGHKDKVYREALYLEGRESLEGGILFAGDSTCTVYEWDIQRRELSHLWKAHEGSVWGMLMASFALISGGLDVMVKLWNPRTRELIRQLYRHNQAVCSLSVQADVFYSCAVDWIGRPGRVTAAAAAAGAAACWQKGSWCRWPRWARPWPPPPLPPPPPPPR
jgi:WD40 repeat protein